MYIDIGRFGYYICFTIGKISIANTTPTKELVASVLDAVVIKETQSRRSQFH
jgi:hypothetical protein